jgi:DNA-binding MarR family transcriptional regulator
MKRYIPLVREFSARVVLFHEAVAARVGLHVTDVKVLRLLGHEGMTPGQLIDHTGLTGAAVTALVDRLVAAGYVTRERDEEDRRRVTVRVVPARMRKIDRLYDSYSVEMSRILARYGAAEFAVIQSFLVQATRLLTEQAAVLREPTGEASRREHDEDG